MQVVVAVPSNIAAAAASIRLNQELAGHISSDNNTRDDEGEGATSSTDEAEDANGGDGAAPEFRGTLMCDDSDPQWVSFSSKQKQKCLASMNKLIATSGQDGAYEFVDPLHVRCNLCVANGLDPHICNPQGVHGVGAIISLSKREFCVDCIVTTATRQLGHHHIQHGSM